MGRLKGKIETNFNSRGEIIVKYSGNFPIEVVEKLGYAQARLLATQYGYSRLPPVKFVSKDITRKL